LSTASKILSLENLGAWRDTVRRKGLRIVATNGCFDLLHAGHVTYLEAAREQGDLLLVGLNSDGSVRQLKGPERPINNQDDRARVLAALQCVDAVYIFDDLHATRLLQFAQPDIYVKGGDLTLEEIPAEERQAVKAGDGRVLIMPLAPGRSTSRILSRIQQTPPPGG